MKFKGSVDLISSDPTFKELHVRFPSVTILRAKMSKILFFYFPLKRQNAAKTS